MIADIVTVFMNSARKNSAKRIERVLGVEAADQLLLGLDEVERRAVELGGARDDEDHERHHAGDEQVPPRDQADPASPAWLSTMSWVDSEPGQQHDRDHRQAERGLVGDHLRRCPDRAEQRVLRAG